MTQTKLQQTIGIELGKCKSEHQRAIYFYSVGHIFEELRGYH
jgi:hypothetical protein